QRRRDVRLRPHRARRALPAHRLAPHEAARRGRARRPRAARALALLPRHHRHPPSRRQGAHRLMESLATRPLTPADGPAVEAVYRAGIATGHATFEAEPPSDWDTFAAGKRPDLMLVAIDADDRMIGWAAAGPVSARAVYRGVVEHSVYVAPHAAGRGVGSRLLGDLLDLADRSGVWTVQSSIFPENAASLRLHERVGFR